MKSQLHSLIIWMIIASLALSGCKTKDTPMPTGANPLKVLAVESFLSDIVQNVAGKRLVVETLIPIGIDPHAFQPTPQDVVRIAESQLLIVNGAGFESWLDKSLQNAGGNRQVIEASRGLTSRKPSSGEIIDPDHTGDPHFWLDPNNVINYVETIRDGLILADPEGKATYNQNSDRYISRLKDLDKWIKAAVSTIPEQNRLMVTNHESFGYFADRYDFQITGTVIPSTSSEASPSAQQMAALIDKIRQSGVKAIFIETGANPQLAEQIAQEAGVKVITDLYTHSITGPDGPAPGYIEMIKHNVEIITAALK